MSKKILACIVLFFTLISSVYGVPLNTFQDFTAANPTTSRRGQWVQLMARGTGTNDFYVVEVNPATGEIPVSASFVLSNDTNYGVVGANTLRTAAQIGNATGAASFGAGTTSAQTLRVVLPTDQSAIPASQSGTWNITNVSGTVSLPTGAATETTLSSIDGKLNSLGQKTSANSVPVVLASDYALPISLSNDTDYGTVGPNTLRTASQIGNATGEADFDAGNTSAQTLRVVIAADQSPVPVAATQSGQWDITDITGTVSLPTGAATETTLSAINTKLVAEALDFGSSANGVRTSSLIGVGSTAVSNANPVPVSDAGGSITVDGTVAATQSGNWSTRTQDGSGNAITSTSSALDVNVKSSAAKSISLKYRNDYSSVNVTTAAYVQVVASTGAIINKIWVFDSSGSAIILATGAAASEVDVLYIPPGGFDTPIEVNIAAGTRLSIKALDTSATSGQIIINAVN